MNDKKLLFLSVKTVPSWLPVHKTLPGMDKGEKKMQQSSKRLSQRVFELLTHCGVAHRLG